MKIFQQEGHPVATRFMGDGPKPLDVVPKVPLGCGKKKTLTVMKHIGYGRLRGEIVSLSNSMGWPVRVWIWLYGQPEATLSRRNVTMKRVRLYAAALVFVSATVAFADVKPNQLFSDHAVLQSGMPVPVWGIAGDSTAA